MTPMIRSSGDANKVSPIRKAIIGDADLYRQLCQRRPCTCPPKSKMKTRSRARPKLIAPLCRRISFGWRRNGPAWRIKDRTRILRPSADTRTKNRTNGSYLAAPRLRDGRSQRSVTKSLPRVSLEAMGPAIALCRHVSRNVAGSPRLLTSCVALLDRPELRLRAALGRHRTAPLRRRSIRTTPFRGRHGRELEFSPGDS
jgi:hypothetical protein